MMGQIHLEGMVDGYISKRMIVDLVAIAMRKMLQFTTYQLQ